MSSRFSTVHVHVQSCTKKEQNGWSVFLLCRFQCPFPQRKPSGKMKTSWGLLPSGEVTSWNPSFYSPKHHDHAVPDELKVGRSCLIFLGEVIEDQGRTGVAFNKDLRSRSINQSIHTSINQTTLKLPVGWMGKEMEVYPRSFVPPGRISCRRSVQLAVLWLFAYWIVHSPRQNITKSCWALMI